MYEIYFQDIPEPYKSMKNCIKNSFLQNIYSKFEVLFFNGNQYQNIIKTFLFDNLKNHMLITYQLSDLQDNQISIALNTNFQPEYRRFQPQEIINTIFCVESQCIIIEKMQYSLLNEIITDLKKYHRILINANVEFKINKDTSKEEEQVRAEIQSFCKYFYNEINRNEFVNLTIFSIACFLIRRHYYPSSYFKDNSFFTFDQLEEKRQNNSKAKFQKFLFSINKQKIISAHQELMEIIKEIKSDDENCNQIYNFEFKEKDFIKLRLLFTSERSSFFLVIHLKSLYLFSMKRLKYINENSKEYQHEVNFCQNYSHQTLTKFYGFLQARNKIIGFIYEFMSNDSLDSYVLSHPCHINEIFSLMSINRIFQGIDYLHSHSLVHRDLKPSNILLDHDCLPYISDFETIRQLEDDQVKPFETSFDFGTPLYSSPEQNQGKQVSYPTDIYSFGLIVYFLIEKKHFNSNKKEDNNDSEETDFEMPSMENISSNFETLYELCILEEPDERPTKEDINIFIRSQVNLFNYFLGHLLQKTFDINESLLLHYFYESIKIQKEFDECRENIFLFYILYHSLISKNIDLSFLLHIANLYKNGTIVKQDYLKMKEIYNLLADQNNPNALVSLGDCYFTGNGIKQDYIKAKEYYELAAKQNNSKAYLNLGNMYKNGICVKQDYLKAKEYYELSAQHNNSEAILNLGILHELGFGVEQNYMKAMQYYELSAKFGNSYSLYNIGNLYFNGNGVKKNYMKAKEYYEYSSKYGNAIAQLNLGFLYYHGYGVKQDYKKAKEYYEISAKQNNSDALVNLGILYEHGLGVKQNYLKALEYYESAAQLNNSYGFLNLGILYENGFGVNQDYNKARKYYELSSKQKNSNAFLNLGSLYINGNGVKKDYIKARQYYEQSAQLNNSLAFVCLGNIYSKGYGVERDYLIARHYFEKASQYKNPIALFNLGIFYTFGYGVNINYLKAKEYYEISADLNNPDAQINLGLFYFNGLGVKIDYSKAKYYFELAIEHKKSEAFVNLGNIYKNGLGVKKNYLKAKEYYEKAIKLNNKNALLNLGNLYLNGLGVSHDYSRAKYYFEKASEYNDSSAFLCLGDIYYNGHGVQQDYLKAKEYYEKSAKLKNSISYYLLGNLYYNGFGVDQNYMKAKYYFELAARQNNPYAYFALGHLYYNGDGVEKDYTKANKYYQLAAQLNNSSALFHLGKLYSLGENFDIDMSKAIKYLFKCTMVYNDVITEYNSEFFSFGLKYNIYRHRSSNDLGLIYLTVFNDIEKATKFIKEAAFGEYPFAQNNFGLLNQFFFNNFDDAEYMYQRASKHNFALAEYNIGYMLEINGKIPESINYYIKACEHEDEPLNFHNHRHIDKQLEISKIFILTFTKLKLVEYFFNLLNYNEAKKNFIKAIVKLILNDENSPYKFQFSFQQKGNINVFSYLRNFIFKFPLFNFKMNIIKQNTFDNKEINDISVNQIEYKQNNYINLMKMKYKLESDTDEIGNTKLSFTDPGKLFDFIRINEKYSLSFIKEIKSIIYQMKKMLYTYPCAILFGRIMIEEQNEKSNKEIQKINNSFYEGFGIKI